MSPAAEADGLVAAAPSLRSSPARSAPSPARSDDHRAGPHPLGSHLGRSDPPAASPWAPAPFGGHRAPVAAPRGATTASEKSLVDGRRAHLSWPGAQPFQRPWPGPFDPVPPLRTRPLQLTAILRRRLIRLVDLRVVTGPSLRVAGRIRPGGTDVCRPVGDPPAASLPGFGGCPDPTCLVRPPPGGGVARLLRSLTFSGSHPLISDGDQPTADESETTTRWRRMPYRRRSMEPTNGDPNRCYSDFSGRICVRTHAR